MSNKIKPFRFDDIYQDGPELTEQEAMQQKKSFDSIGAAARRCLNSQDFIIYRQQFEAEREKILDSMIMANNQFIAGGIDSACYIASVSRYLQRVMDLKSLLRRVEQDAKRGQPSEVHSGNQ